MNCAICEKRKEKRFCPAIHGRICPQCCGEQREVTLDCPTGCVYLQQARHNEKSPGLAGLRPADIFLQVEIGENFLYEHEHLIMGLTFALAKKVRADGDLKDADLIAAMASLAKTWETLVNSGLHYEAPITNAAQQAVAAEVLSMLKEFREAEQKHVGYVKLRDSEVLRALVFIIRLAYARTSRRPKSRAFVDFLLSQFPEPADGNAVAEAAGSGIVIP